MKVSIDGRELEVEAGTTLLKAAQAVGIDIPTFCYHPGLSAPANCRMCLVNTNKAPKLLPACYSTVMDGMEIQTRDEKTLRTRKSTLEFILLHHPVDCPICDQAGECVLQDNYFAHSAQPSRTFSRKNHKPKATPIGPNVILDAERCIVCTRCVRFCDEITGTHELQVVNRGDRSFVTTFPGRELANDYATNTVDICPVGALTSRDFRFKKRVWFLKSANSVCSGCSKGCNIHVDHADGEVQRYRPRENQAVNGWWMCDPGRLSYKGLQAGRIHEASIGDKAHPLREALAAAARTLHGWGGDVGVVPSLLMTTEDLVALAVLSQKAGWTTWYVGGRAPGKEDALLQRADKNPNRAGFTAVAAAFGLTVRPLGELLGSHKGLLWVGHEHAGADAYAARAKVALASNRAAVLDNASVTLPMRTFEEVDGSWTNSDGLVQALSQGPAPTSGVLPAWEVLFKLVRALGHMDVKPPANAAAVRDFAGDASAHLASSTASTAVPAAA